MRRALGVLALFASLGSGCDVSHTPAASLYTEEQVGTGRYQLLNTQTGQFVEGTADGLRTVCGRGRRGRCVRDVLIDVTLYAGHTQLAVSQRQFTLTARGGIRATPASGRQATRVVAGTALLSKTVLQPDEDADFASGTLVFPVPSGAGPFSLAWRGHHVATVVLTAKGTLSETR